MADIFLSHAHTDRPRVEALATALEKHLSVWWDKELGGTYTWRDELEREINAARCVLVLWSAESVKRPFVRDEAQRADNRKVLQAVLLDEVEVPLGFGEGQYLDLRAWNSEADDPLLDELLIAPLQKRLRGNRLALLVGVEVYREAQNFLAPPSAHANVETLHRLLATRKDTGFRVEIVAETTSTHIKKALERFFKEAAPNDTVLLYYCGNAKVFAPGDLYLCPTDAEAEFLDSTAISVEWLAKRALNVSSASQLLIVLDCFYSAVAGAPGKLDVPTILVTGLGKGQGKYVLTGCTVPGQDIAEAGAKVSRVVRWFDQGITSFEADDGDGVITADEICRYVQTRIEAEKPDLKPLYKGFDTSSSRGEIARRRTSAEPTPTALRGNRDFFVAVRGALDEGKLVPLVGDGIFGSGPLGSFQLIGALIRTAGLEAGMRLDERYPLATASEYLLQVYRGERGAFLKRLTAILEEQSAAAIPTDTHRFLATLRPPWIIVSATYDWMLEKLLEDARLPFTVVSHIIAADDESLAGRLLVIRRGGSASAVEVKLADNWILRDLGDHAGRVIYKIVGSPFANALGEPDSGVDTVVITETDHMKFLARLQNEHTKPPTAFSPFLRQRALLFLGYNLDVWHYRLIGHIFSNEGQVRPRRRYAVRTAVSPIEERFWAHLVAAEDRLQSDCEAFVQTLRQFKP